MKASLRGYEKLKAFLAELPRGTKIAAMRAAAEYFVGDEQHGLKHPTPYKFVSRASAYGAVSSDGAPDGYFSWKQFRYVAAITEGFTKTYERTGNIEGGWNFAEKNSDWQTVNVYNDVPGAEFVYGDETQARQPAKVGWRKMSKIILDNMKGAIQAAQRAVDEYIKSKR